MMMTKYNVNITTYALKMNLERLTNQIYKLLPEREEKADWVRPLENIIEEVVGLNALFEPYQYLLFPLLCKLEGLFSLNKESDFLIYRRTIFECLNLISQLNNKLK